MENLVVLLKEGHFAHIGLSSAAQKRCAAHMRWVYPVTAAEIEVNLWSYESETKKVIETARELDIAVFAYSPIGKGFLGGRFSSAADLPTGDYRSRLTRFKDGNLEHNLQVVSALPELAAKKGVTPAQLAIAWVAALGPHIIPLPRLLYGFADGGKTARRGDIELSWDEMAAMNAIAEAGEVRGDRMAGGTGVGASLG
ncbi:NADP-dependent oxidoreductase domain-containing protein [Mycena olivaceomarginata]|nr:NADP-dependent oxidoreductase domain-containing protein [Mycena olivaceomarginata]